MKDKLTIKLIVILVILFITILFTINIKLSIDLNDKEYSFIKENLNLIFSFFSLIFSIITLWFGVVAFDKFGIRSLTNQKEYFAALELKKYLEMYQIYSLSLNTIIGNFPKQNIENENSLVNYDIEDSKSIFFTKEDLHKIYSDIKNKILNTENLPSELSKKLNLSFLIYIYNDNPYYKYNETPKEDDYIFSIQNKEYDNSTVFLKYENEKSFINNWKELITEIDKYLYEKTNSSKSS